jgi:hypothetical protein
MTSSQNLSFEVTDRLSLLSREQLAIIYKKLAKLFVEENDKESIIQKQYAAQLKKENDKESIIQKQYAAQLKKENTKLVKTIRKKQSNLRVYNQVNFYYSQNEVMFVYIQKVLTILYAVIYFFFMYFLYSNQEKYSRQMIILYLVIFLLLPFTFHLISKFLYNSFLMFLQIFNNGNAAYLYSTVPSGQN